MIFRKNMKYYQRKITIDKANNKNTAYQIQLYNDRLIDKYVESFSSDEDLTSKPTVSQLWAELSILNRPDVYNNYQKIINSKYTSNDAIDNIIIKNKANKDLNRIVEAEVERISKNLDYVEQVMRKYNAPFEEYKRQVKQQKANSVGNRQQILKEVAIKANDLLVNDGLNIPSNVYSYRNLEATAENLLRQSQMMSKHERINAINENAINEGKDKVYNGKEWIWTGAGKTTRHASNHLQKRQVNEPFIIVNDATLEIDDLMYPSDPDGSYGNTFICYCEVEYLTEEVDDLGYKVTTPSSTVKPVTPVTQTPVTPSKPIVPSTLGIKTEPTTQQLKENLTATERAKYSNYERNIKSHEQWLNDNPNADVKLINNRRQKLETARKNLEDLRLKALGTPKTEPVTPTVKTEPVKPVVKEEPKPTVNEQIKTVKEETKKPVEPINEPTLEQLKTNLTKEELEQVEWAKGVLEKDFIKETGKQMARQTLEELYSKARNGTPKPKTESKTTNKPIETKTEPKTQSTESMTSQELYESMTKADKKKYDKLKQKIENADKNIKQLGENPILLDIKKKNLLELRKLEQKQRDKLTNKGKRKPKTKTVREHERTLDNIHNETEIPTTDLIPKLEKWITKRCKNTSEFGYHFDIKTGEIIGGEIRGSKGRIAIEDKGEGAGSIHSHPRNGMSAPSIEDLETFRCKKEQHHFMVSEHEIWYVKATDSFGIGGMGQQLDLQAAHKECRNRAFKTVEAEIKKGTVEANEDSIAKALDKYTGDEILKTFNKPPWNKTLTVKRYYR